METMDGSRLAEGVRRKIRELKAECAGIEEETAGQAPAGRWSPKEVLSHLLGPKEDAYLHLLRIFMEKDNPTINLDPGNPFFSEERGRTPFGDLVAGVERQYEKIAVFAEGLTGHDLARTAHIPQFKDSPLGENLSLEAMIKGLGQHHVQMHVEQLREIKSLSANKS